MDRELEELKFAARYPFTRLAKERITGKEVKIDYEVMERASWRAHIGIMREDIPMLDTDDRNLLIKELLSYPIARMIVSLIGGKYTNRYINAEVRRAIRYMQDNPGDDEKLAKEFGIELIGNGVDIKSYLKYLPKNKDYDIVNQSLVGGIVQLDSGGIKEIMREAIRQSVQAGMPIKKENIPKEILTDLEEMAKKIHSEVYEANIAVERVGRIEIGGEIPPCMNRLIEQLKNGGNVPHVGRWVIATYLMRRGFGIDEIVALFSNTPNFNEKTTRYQLEFIKKKGYGIPTCANLDSYGLCIERCDIINPIQYGRKLSKHTEMTDRRKYKKVI
ncbi:MAG: hypothetical protein QW112_01650 [Candidatus Micrarchaeia archaeon]